MNRWNRPTDSLSWLRLKRYLRFCYVSAAVTSRTISFFLCHFRIGSGIGQHIKSIACSKQCKWLNQGIVHSTEFFSYNFCFDAFLLDSNKFFVLCLFPFPHFFFINFGNFVYKLQTARQRQSNDQGPTYKPISIYSNILLRTPYCTENHELELRVMYVCVSVCFAIIVSVFLFFFLSLCSYSSDCKCPQTAKALLVRRAIYVLISTFIYCVQCTQTQTII